MGGGKTLDDDGNGDEEVVNGNGECQTERITFEEQRGDNGEPESGVRFPASAVWKKQFCFFPIHVWKLVLWGAPVTER